jgi:hypothetical protein
MKREWNQYIIKQRVVLSSLLGELRTASAALGAEPGVLLFQLCDVVLKIGADTIHAHRVVLASVSPYFYAMFNGKLWQHASSHPEARADFLTFRIAHCPSGPSDSCSPAQEIPSHFMELGSSKSCSQKSI